MAMQVITSAQMTCTKGTAPCPLVATTALLQVSAGKPGMVAATVMDHKPIINIATFGMCTTESNPMVKAATTAATAAAQGVYTLTPMPCIPMTDSPWSQGSKKIKICKAAALNDSSKCKCKWSGEISITSAGQTSVNIP